MEKAQIEHNNITILLKAAFLTVFSAVFMFVFYVSRWFPGEKSNVLLALGFGLAVGLPFLISSFVIREMTVKGKTIFSKVWFKLSLHFSSVYICVLIFSAFTNTLVVEWQQFFIIFGVLALIGSLPSLIFYYYGKYELYRAAFLVVEEENKNLSERIDQLKNSFTRTSISIPVRNGSYHLDLKEFCYAESDKNYLILTFSSLESVQIRTSVKQFLEACKHQKNILQIHRAFIINVNHFNRFQSGFAWIDSQNIKLPISKSFRHKILSEIEE